jgi:protein gp37
MKRILTGLGQLALIWLGIAIAIATAAAVLAVLDDVPAAINHIGGFA